MCTGNIQCTLWCYVSNTCPEYFGVSWFMNLLLTWRKTWREFYTFRINWTSDISPHGVRGTQRLLGWMYPPGASMALWGSVQNYPPRAVASEFADANEHVFLWGFRALLAFQVWGLWCDQLLALNLTFLGWKWSVQRRMVTEIKLEFVGGEDISDVAEAFLGVVVFWSTSGAGPWSMMQQVL